MIWNVRDERLAWVAALTEIMRPYAGSTPRFDQGHWRRLFPAKEFEPLTEFQFDHVHQGPPEKVIVQRALSVSFVAALPVDEQEMTAHEVRNVISSTAALAGKNEVAFPYRTLAAHCSRV